MTKISESILSFDQDKWEEICGQPVNGRTDERLVVKQIGAGSGQTDRRQSSQDAHVHAGPPSSSLSPFAGQGCQMIGIIAILTLVEVIFLAVRLYCCQT